MNKLTVNDILTSSGRYPEREKHSECTEEVRKNAESLCERVNAFLEAIGYKGNPDITSGFRTSEANSATANSGKKSKHMLGAACDILDNKEQTLAKTAANSVDLLAKYDLYMEDPSKTVGKFTNWLHLQSLPPGSKKRVFLP